MNKQIQKIIITVLVLAVTIWLMISKSKYWFYKSGKDKKPVTKRQIESLRPYNSTSAFTLPNSEQRKFEGVTEDKAVMEFFTLRMPKEVGEVRSLPNHRQQLWISDKLVFEAASIERRRSIAITGAVALAAVGGGYDMPNESMPEAGIDGVVGKKPEIWIVLADGTKKRISPPHVSGSFPLISPNGNYVAFTGVGARSDGPLSTPHLFLVDVNAGDYRIFGGKEPQHEYNVSPAEWSEDSSSLAVLEDWGETGGHLTMKQIRLR